MNQLDAMAKSILANINAVFIRCDMGSKLSRVSLSLNSYILAPMNKGNISRGAVIKVLKANVPKDNESSEARSKFV